MTPHLEAGRALALVRCWWGIPAATERNEQAHTQPLGQGANGVAQRSGGVGLVVAVITVLGLALGGHSGQAADGDAAPAHTDRPIAAPSSPGEQEDNADLAAAAHRAREQYAKAIANIEQRFWSATRTRLLAAWKDLPHGERERLAALSRAIVMAEEAYRPFFPRDELPLSLEKIFIVRRGAARLPPSPPRVLLLPTKPCDPERPPDSGVGWGMGEAAAGGSIFEAPIPIADGRIPEQAAVIAELMRVWRTADTAGELGPWADMAREYARHGGPDSWLGRALAAVVDAPPSDAGTASPSAKLRRLGVLQPLPWVPPIDMGLHHARLRLSALPGLPDLDRLWWALGAPALDEKADFPPEAKVLGPVFDAMAPPPALAASTAHAPSVPLGGIVGWALARAAAAPAPERRQTFLLALALQMPGIAMGTAPSDSPSAKADFGVVACLWNAEGLRVRRIRLGEVSGSAPPPPADKGSPEGPTDAQGMDIVDDFIPASAPPR